MHLISRSLEASLTSVQAEAGWGGANLVRLAGDYDSNERHPPQCSRGGSGEGKTLVRPILDPLVGVSQSSQDRTVCSLDQQILILALEKRIVFSSNKKYFTEN